MIGTFCATCTATGYLCCEHEKFLFTLCSKIVSDFVPVSLVFYSLNKVGGEIGPDHFSKVRSNIKMSNK